MGYEFVTSSDLTRDNDNSTLFFRKKVSPITYMTSQCTKGQEIQLFLLRSMSYHAFSNDVVDAGEGREALVVLV